MRGRVEFKGTEGRGSASLHGELTCRLNGIVSLISNRNWH